MPAGARRRVMVQYAIGERHEAMLAISRSHHERYCARLGIAYSADDKTPVADKRPHWRKVSLVLEAFAAGFDEVLWLDADSVVIDTSVDVFDFSGYEISCCECYDSPREPRHFNTGVVFFKRTDATLRFVETWNGIADDHVGWADQKAFVMLMQDRANRDLLTVMPNRLNWVPVHMETTAPIIGSAHGAPHELREQLMREWVAGLVRRDIAGW